MNKKIVRVSIIVLLVVLSLVMSSCKKDVEYTLNFDVDGTTYKTITTLGDAEISIPENPSKEGYKFLGWFWDKDVWEN